MHSEIKNRLVWLFVLAAIIHALVLFVGFPVLGHRLAPSYNQDRFADGYDLLAENLVAGNGYRFYPDTARTLMREPGYPLILAGLMLVFGKNLVAVKVTNMILALLTAGLTIRIAGELMPEAWSSESVMLFGPPLLFLFSPGTIVAESRGGVEITFGFLLALLILSIYRAIRSNRCRDYVISGVVLGFTLLVRSTPILFPIPLLALLLYFDGRCRGFFVVFRNIGLLIVTAFLILSPWIVRNFWLTGRFVPTASVMGVSAQAGQYINEHLFEGRPWWLLDREASRQRDKIAVSLGYPFEDGTEGYYQTFYNSIDEIRFSDHLMKDVVLLYKKNPALLVRCVAQNTLNFWFAGKNWRATAVNVILQFPYLVLAAIGALYCIKERKSRAITILLLFMAYYVAVHVAILAQARYSVPLMPFMSALGATGIVWIRVHVVKAGSTRQRQESGLLVGNECLAKGYAVGDSGVNRAVLEILQRKAGE